MIIVCQSHTHTLSAAVRLCGYGPCSSEFLSRLKRLPSGKGEGASLKTVKEMVAVVMVVVGGGGDKRSRR